MTAHLSGGILNIQQLAHSLGVSSATIKSYMYILEQTFILRLLKPYTANIKKRLIKSPKLYIRDSGILHALLNIENYENFLGNPIYGNSWEGFVIENIITSHPNWKPYFYRTSHGAEIDLILERNNKKIAIECKASIAPTISRGFYSAMDDLSINQGYVIAPVKDSYPIRDNVMVMSLKEFMAKRSMDF
jgi:predicted AAA+ superfamily ATPase